MQENDQDLDVAAVERYLRSHLNNFDRILSVAKFETGQSNPTFLLETPSKRYVLRRKPPGILLKSAHAVDREFWVQRALKDSNVPVAHMHLLCEDENLIGSSFYVMDYVDGNNFVEPTLKALTNDDRTQIFDEINRVLANLHTVNIDAVGLTDFGPKGNYYERQLKRWSKQYAATETQAYPEMDELIDALQRSLPCEDGQRGLVHGDFRIDNMIFDTTSHQCVAVLDWELSTIGHPYADLAGVIMQWQLPPGIEGRGLAGVDRKSIGLPTDQEFIEAYCERRGLPAIKNFGFYLGFSFFRMAAILQGVLKRALDGNASNPQRALKLGDYVPLFARKGLESLAK